jgi:hypothetical protein
LLETITRNYITQNPITYVFPSLQRAHAYLNTPPTMFPSVLLLLASAALSTAQSTTASPSGPVVSLFLPDTDPQQLVASVIGSSGSMTTYVITCPEGTDASDCGYSDPVTITEGASSLVYSQVCFRI